MACPCHSPCVIGSGSKRETYDGCSSSSSSKQGNEADANTAAIDRYIGEKDAWQKFTATGEKSDRIRSVDRESKKWEDRLEEIPPKKS